MHTAEQVINLFSQIRRIAVYMFLANDGLPHDDLDADALPIILIDDVPVAVCGPDFEDTVMLMFGDVFAIKVHRSTCGVVKRDLRMDGDLDAVKLDHRFIPIQFLDQAKAGLISRRKCRS